MGQRLAPVLAIANMSKIEKPLLDRRPIVYCRYIDDCFVVCSMEEEMDTCYDLLNRQAENIKFTREKPKDHWLPFLNTQVRLEGGFYRTKWYRKPSSKNILVHFNSAHPFKTKRAFTSNMFKTATMVSSGRLEKTESMELARTIALSNGYPVAPKNSYGLYKKEQCGPVIDSLDEVAFCIPYISDAVSCEIRSALHRCGLKDMVRVVESHLKILSSGWFETAATIDFA
uniref:Reverse transcriptase domain-containing protein n=1 Tax=Haemonchus contortus TaxID=6289 RepID=A0A7I4YY43_HAECO